MLDLKKMDKQLTEALEKETRESLKACLNENEKISSKGVKMEKKIKCEDCCYFCVNSKSELECRLNPPQYYEGRTFPIVKKNLWCGKFKKDIPS